MFRETEEGLLISPKEALVMKLLDEIDEGLKAKGITLDELISAGRQIREEIYNEKYAAEGDEYPIHRLKCPFRCYLLYLRVRLESLFGWLSTKKSNWLSARMLLKTHRNIERKVPDLLSMFDRLLDAIDPEIVPSPSKKAVRTVEEFVAKKGAFIITAAIKANVDSVISQSRSSNDCSSTRMKNEIAKFRLQ